MLLERLKFPLRGYVSSAVFRANAKQNSVVKNSAFLKLETMNFITKTSSGISCNTNLVLYVWGLYHQEPSSELITLKSLIFPVKNSNLQSSGLVGLVAKSSDFKTKPFL
mgnify:CR=1 FL=1